MDNADQKLKPIIQEIEYGNIRIKLDEILKARGITNYELSNKANIRFQTIQTLRENQATRIDFGVLSKLCYVLGCKVEDIIEYVDNK